MENNLILVENSTPDNILNTQVILGTINFDVELVKEKVGKFLSKYNGLIIEKEDIKQIKSEIAFLRKQKELINKNRIKLSKEFDIPLVQYKSDCDSIIELIEQSISGLNNQVSSFEEKEKEEKRKNIEEIMEKMLKMHSLDGEFEFEFDPRYLNTTYTMNKVKEDLDRQIREYYNLINAQKVFEEKQKMKKQLLETTINLLNSKNDFVKPMSYVEFENLLDDVKYDELEEHLYKIANKREKKEILIKKEPEIVKKEIKQYNNLNTNSYTLTLVNITEEKLQQIEEKLKELNVDYFFDTNNFNPIMDLIG